LAASSLCDVFGATCPKYGYCNIIKGECLSGQCVAYCKQRTGYSGPVRQAKDWARNWPKPVKGGVVLLNLGYPSGHVAYIESLDEKKKMFTVTQYNAGTKFKCKECGVTNLYGVQTSATYRFDDRRILGYWKGSRSS
jgi:predicted nucleic-acid-binding Zn-ribbon protein